MPARPRDRDARRSRAGRPMWLGGLLALLAAACHGDRSPRLPVAVAGAIDRSGHDEAAFDEDNARRALEKALRASRRLSLESPDETGVYTAELTITLATEQEAVNPGETGRYRGVQVELLLSRWGDGGVREKILAQGEAFEVQDPDAFTPTAGFERVLGKAVKDAVQNLESELESRELPLEKLAELLSSTESAQRLAALRALRERRAPQWVPRVIELLQDPVPDVVLEAVGVLVAQGDPRAVEPIIRAAQSRDQLFLLQAISALAELGGPVARGYLFTLSAGHDSPAIRERAARALQESERAAGDRSRTAAQQPHRSTGIP